MEGLISTIVFLCLVAVAFVTGSLIERRHYNSIKKREQDLISIPLITSKKWSEESGTSKLVSGSVVISADYFKVFLGGLRTIVGGKITAFESLVDRGRREAVLRMKKQAGHSAKILNVRIETSKIGINMVEVFAYGTAVYSNSHEV